MPDKVEYLEGLRQQEVAKSSLRRPRDKSQIELRVTLDRRDQSGDLAREIQRRQVGGARDQHERAQGRRQREGVDRLRNVQAADHRRRSVEAQELLRAGAVQELPGQTGDLNQVGP